MYLPITRSFCLEFIDRKIPPSRPNSLLGWFWIQNIFFYLLGVEQSVFSWKRVSNQIRTSAVRRPFQYRFHYGKLSNTKSIVFYWRIIWCKTRYGFIFRVIQLLLVFNFLMIFKITKFWEELSHKPLITIIFCNTQVALWNRWLCTGWVWPGEHRRVAALPNPVVETWPPLLKPQQTHTTIVSHSPTPPYLLILTTTSPENLR